MLKFVVEVKFIILTSPRPKRVDRIQDDLMKQGSVLADFISTDPRRIVMVISGDLSHMYQYDCTEDWYTPSTSSNLYATISYSLPKGTLGTSPYRSNFFHLHEVFCKNVIKYVVPSLRHVKCVPKNQNSG